MRLRAALLLFVAFPVLAAEGPSTDGVDARVLSEFKTFAEREVAAQKDGFRRYIENFIEEPIAGIRTGRKFLFSGFKVEAVPDVWTFDVRKTDSIVSPYRAVIEFPVIFIRASIWVRGEREFCERQTLKNCLDHGGELYETAIMYKSSAQRIPHNVEREYLYQDGSWAPKSDFDLVLKQIALALDTANPMTPSRAPSLFGIPPSPSPTPE